MADNQVNRIVEMLINSTLTSYFIAKKTGITEQTLSNYRNKKTIPTNANAKLLEYFFNEINVNNSAQNSENGQRILLNGSNNNHINAENYASTALETSELLRSRLTELERMIQEKDARICEYERQLKEKDSQIKSLLSILKGADEA